jgi:hypothetical protein
MLLDAGLLTVADIPAFEMLCYEYDLIRRDPAGPYNHARDRYRKMLIEFGMTPAARLRVKSATAQPLDRMAEFLSRQRVKK